MDCAMRSIPDCGMSIRTEQNDAADRQERGATMGHSLGIDIGGTFTDLVVMDQETGELLMLKTPSVPAHPSHAVINGIEEMVERFRLDPGAIPYFVPGTTL